MKKVEKSRVNTRQLSVLYCVLLGAYWTSFCCVYSFANVLLTSKGFTPSEIGIAVAIGNVLGVIFQPIIAGIADRSKRISLMSITLILCLLGAALFGLVWLIPNVFLAVMGLFCISDALLQIIQPLTNSVSIYYVNKGVSVNFGVSRSVGSITYAVLSSVLGVVVAQYGEVWIVILGVGLILLMAAMLFVLPRVKSEETELSDQKRTKDELSERGAVDKLSEATEEIREATPRKRGSILDFIRSYRSFCLVLVGITFLFTFHNMTNNYMLNIVERIGGNASHMGIAFSIAAVCEIPTMILYSKLAKKAGAKRWLVISAGFFALKSLSYLLIFNIPILYATQVLQMTAFGLYMPASVQYVNEEMAPKDQFKGQAVMTGTNTLGGLLGSLLGGFLVDYVSIQSMIIAGAVLSTIGAVIVFIGIRKNN